MKKDDKNKNKVWSSLFERKQPKPTPKKDDRPLPSPPKSPPSKRDDRYIPPPPRDKVPSCDRSIPPPPRRKPTV